MMVYTKYQKNQKYAFISTTLLSKPLKSFITAIVTDAFIDMLLTSPQLLLKKKKKKKKNTVRIHFLFGSFNSYFSSLFINTTKKTETLELNNASHRLLLATRSSSSFFLMAKELELPLAALMSSSARHSAIVLMLRKEASRAPMVRRAIAWLTRRRGDTSTA